MPSKHAFYRSLGNGVIYPAMQSMGEDQNGKSLYYQDEHPTEWQPASEEDYKEQCRREDLLARRNDVLDVTPTVVAVAAPAPAPAVGLVPPPAPPSATVEA